MVASAVLWGCTYDFDAAFSETPAGGGGPGGTGGTTSSSGTGGTTSSSGTGGTTSSSGTGGSGGTAGGENCTNGVDDDGDQDIDCADSDCTTHLCAAPAPPGWSGPVTVVVSAVAQALPSCAGAWPSSADHDHGLDAPDAECSKCSCSSPSVQCTLAGVVIHTGTSCSGSVEQTLSPQASGVCSSFTSQDMDTLEGLQSQASSGSCTESGGTASLPPVAWTEHARICEGAVFGLGCEDSDPCVPAPTGPFQLCVTQAGNQACPTGYGDKTLLYGGFTDTRGCSSCSCGSAQNAQCNSATEIWNVPNCAGGPDATVPNDGVACLHEHLLVVSSGSFMFTAAGNAGACPTAGGAPNGTATETDPTTVCCRP
jgi:hypothetical protein